MLDEIFLLILSGNSSDHNLFILALTTLPKMFTEKLIKAGLTNNETKIYVCLLHNSDLSASEVTKKTGIHRRNVYDAISRLLEKGIVNETLVNNKRRFNAVHPDNLMQIVETRKQELQSIIPDLTKLFQAEKTRNFVKIYRGIPGVRSSFTDSLNMMKNGETYYAIGCVDMRKILGSFFDDHHKERIEKKIKSKLLFNYQYKERAKQIMKKKNFQIRLLPKDCYLPVQTAVYGKATVCQILIHENPFVVQVVDEEFAKNYIKYFETLWDISKPV